MLSNLEKQLKATEDERASQFKAFLGQFEEDFFNAESTRKQPEKKRGADFITVQSGRHERFMSAETFRYKQFKEVEAEQEDIFHSNEDRRMVLFRDAQEARKGVFDETMVRHREENEQLIATIESLYSSGRKRREESAYHIIETILQDFNTFLRSTQDRALQAHFERKGIMRRKGRVVSRTFRLSSWYSDC